MNGASAPVTADAQPPSSVEFTSPFGVCRAVVATCVRVLGPCEGPCPWQRANK